MTTTKTFEQLRSEHLARLVDDVKRAIDARTYNPGPAPATLRPLARFN